MPAALPPASDTPAPAMAAPPPGAGDRPSPAGGTPAAPQDWTAAPDRAGADPAPAALPEPPPEPLAPPSAGPSDQPRQPPLPDRPVSLARIGAYLATLLPRPAPAGGLPPALASQPLPGPVELRLSPEELGSITLSFTVEAGVLRVHVQADRPDTLDLMRRHGDQFLADLRQGGQGGATLSFAGGDPHPQRGRWQAAYAGPSEPPPPAPALPHPPPGHSGTAGLYLRL